MCKCIDDENNVTLRDVFCGDHSVVIPTQIRTQVGFLMLTMTKSLCLFPSSEWLERRDDGNIPSAQSRDRSPFHTHTL